MLKALLLSLTLFALAGMSTAQNLVPNGGFEDTVDCYMPTQCTLLKAAHWRNPTSSTPDVWDCDLDRACGYEMDTLNPGPTGSQSAAPGKRFAGYYLWDGPDAPVREYAMVRLQAPLISGHPYEVSLKYSRADGFMYAIDHIGVWFGMDSLNSPHPYRLEVAPQLRLRSIWDNHLLEQDEWETISASMVAAGGEQWMVIGLFDAEEEVDAIVANPGSVAPSAYYFVDDVSVVPVEDVGITEAGSGATVWWTGSRLNSLEGFKCGLTELMIWDETGRLLDRSVVWIQEDGAIPIDTQLRPGFYVVQLQIQGTVLRFRFVKEEGGL